MGRELDEQCALALGWTKRHSPAHAIYAWEIPSGERVTMAQLPRFSTDHLAVRLLEDEIERRGKRNAYLTHLLQELCISTSEHEGYNADCIFMDDAWGLLRAMPEQKARAFLKAVEE